MTLYASYARSEDSALAGARVRAITDYLVSAWGIDRGRISHKLLRSGADATSVSIGASPKLLSPLVNEWTQTGERLPEIAIERSIVSNSGIRSWTIDVFDDTTLINRFSSASDVGPQGMFADPRIRSGEHRLLARLTAADTVGNIAVTVDSLRILPPTAASTHLARSAESYVIPVDSLDNEHSWSSLLLERVAKSQTDSSIIHLHAVYASGRPFVTRAAKRLFELLERQHRSAGRVVLDDRSVGGDPPALISSYASSVVEIIVENR
jgi:hypothetical protein